MEKNIGYAVITTEEYKKIIEDNILKKQFIEELNKVNKEEKEIYEKFREYFFKKIVKDEEYYLKNMKECNPTDYHYQELYKCFLEIGINNAQYIDEKIKELKDNFDSGNYKGDEE